MKKIAQLIALLFFVLVFDSCKKTINLAPAAGVAACKLTTEANNILGGNSEYQYEYEYDKNGKLTTIKKYIGGGYHVLEDSSIIGDNTIASYGGLNYQPGNVFTIVYNASIFDGLPTKANVSITDRGITATDIYTYFFFYDNKNRLVKVGEQTDRYIGDWEYDLLISYNDQDNVTGLRYEWTTGPRTFVTITTSGYDDKPTPFAGIKSWYFLMHAAWDNSDPEPVFTALSKNNPLGYTFGDWKRAMAYTYNDQGFPVTRINTNSNSSGTRSYRETFDYRCK